MAVLAQYNGGAATADSADANVTAGNLTNGSLTSFNVNQTLGYASDPAYTAFRSAAAATNIADAITNNSYFSVTVTPASGYTMNLTSLTFTAARGGASTPRGYGVRSSIDSYASSLGTADLATQRTTWTNVSIDLTGASFQGIGAITFRIYIYAPINTVSVDLDTIALNGTMVAPATSTGNFFQFL